MERQLNIWRCGKECYAALVELENLEAPCRHRNFLFSRTYLPARLIHCNYASPKGSVAADAASAESVDDITASVSTSRGYSNFEHVCSGPRTRTRTDSGGTAKNAGLLQSTSTRDSVESTSRKTLDETRENAHWFKKKAYGFAKHSWHPL